jgi:hypothetical protein
MTKLAILRTAFLGTSWKCQFAEHLTRLRPDLNPDAADEISDSVYPHHDRFTPAEAARRWQNGQLTVQPRNEPEEPDDRFGVR